MPWQQATHEMAKAGTVFMLDGLLCHRLTLIGRGILSPDAAARMGTAINRIEQTLTESNPFAPQFATNVAGVGKVFLEHGTEACEDALALLKEAPELLVQEGKAVGQVVNEVATMANDAEFMGSTVAGNSFKDKVSNFFRRFHKEKQVEGILETGARRVKPTDAYTAEIVWAPKKYDDIRACTDDIQKIAANTGMPEHKILRIKQHVFFDETHILDNGIRRFDPDAEIAAAWDRLITGDFIPSDIMLLEHEYFESKFEKIFRTDYRTAHQRTESSGREWIPPQP